MNEKVYQEQAQLADTQPRAHAVAELCVAATRLAGYRRTMSLSIHNLSRDEFDSFAGDERRCVSDGSGREWWSKTVRLHESVGHVELYLYTDEAPCEPETVAAVAQVAPVDRAALDRLAPLPGRPGWRVDRQGHEWYSAAWLDEARERS